MNVTHAAAALLVALLLTAPFAPDAGAHGTASHGTLGVVDAPAAAVGTADAPSATETISGAIHELIVDDSTRGVSQRYVELERADGTLVELKGDAAQALVGGSTIEIRGRRDGKAFRVERVRTLAAPGAAVPKDSIEVDGTLAILHADFFDADRGEFIYEVHGAQGRVHELRMAAAPSALEPGTQVRVRGRAGVDGASITPDRITIVARSAASADAVTTKAAVANSVLVIMANFNNTTAPTYTAAQAQQVMTSNTNSVANFFRETSYGQQLMNVTVTPGWVTMNMAKPAACGTTDWRNIGTNAEAAAKALGAQYDPAAYNFVVYLYPPVSSCGWTGLAYISNPHKAWINGTGAFTTPTIAHDGSQLRPAPRRHAALPDVDRRHVLGQ